MCILSVSDDIDCIGVPLFGILVWQTVEMFLIIITFITIECVRCSATMIREERAERAENTRQSQQNAEAIEIRNRMQSRIDQLEAKCNELEHTSYNNTCKGGNLMVAQVVEVVEADKEHAAEENEERSEERVDNTECIEIHIEPLSDSSESV